MLLGDWLELCFKGWGFAPQNCGCDYRKRTINHLHESVIKHGWVKTIKNIKYTLNYMNEPR